MYAYLMALTVGVAGGVSLPSRSVAAQEPIVSIRGIVDSPPLQELLARRVTLRLDDVSIKRGIDSAAHAANVVVQYKVSMIMAHTTPVTLHVKDASLGEVLERLLNGTGLRVAFDQQGALAIVAGPQDEADSIPGNGTMVGRVVDSASGRGVGGATVKIQGTQLSAVSGDSGRFRIPDVPAGSHVFTARLFGHRPVTEEVTIAANAVTTVRVVMVSVPNVLSGVVTTASGQIRKVEVGNDITTLNVDSVMKVAPIQSVTDLLETRVPGLTIQHTSGVPGDPSRLRLRGAGSINLNNDPIVIIDGVRVYAAQSDRRNDNLSPVQIGGSNYQNAATSGFAAPSPLDQIDPNSIQTVEVFKGPSASALYGSDAANGVIVITTKRGQAGPTHWDLSLGAATNWLPGDWPVNYYRFGTETRNGTYGLCTWADRFCQTDSIVPYQVLNDSRYSVFSHGNNQTATLTLSGGVQTTQWSISGTTDNNVGYLKLPGFEQDRIVSQFGSVPHYLLRPDNYKTWGINGSLTTTPSAALHVTIQSSLFNGAQQRSSLEGAIPYLATEYISNTDSVYSASAGVTSLITSPLIANDVERITDNSLTSTNMISLNWQPWTWLPITATGGINTKERTDVSYIPFGLSSIDVNGAYSGDCKASAFGCDTTGYYGLGRGTSRDQTLSLGTTIPFLHQKMTLAAGGNIYQSSTADFRAHTSDLAPGVTAPTNFNCPVSSPGCENAAQSTTDASTYGWYLEPRLNVASRFFVAPGFRLDGGSGGSTSSGSIGGLSAFPKLNFSWLAIDRQDQAPLWGVISQLRPRIAFGLAGTQPPPEQRLRLINPYSTRILDLNDSTQAPSVYIGTLGNTQLRPERSTEFEGGFDATLWQDRVTITYTQYRKTRRDAILQIPTAPSLGYIYDNTYSLPGGYGGIDKNIGDVRNTGHEVTLTVIPIQRRALAWTVNANLSQDKNVVVRLNPGQPPICLSGLTYCASRITPGYPLASTWARPIISFSDANGDGVIEDEEVRLADSSVYIGQETPNYQMNVASDLTMFNGRLSVHGTFAYTNGLTQVNKAALNGSAFTLLPNAPGTTLATQAAVIASGNISAGGNNLPGSIIGLVQTVNTFRFNDLSVNYQVPKEVSHWFRVPRMMVAVQGSNLGLHTNYRGKDPNVNAYSTSSGEATIDSGQMPEPRTWWLRINLGN